MLSRTRRGMRTRVNKSRESKKQHRHSSTDPTPRNGMCPWCNALEAQRTGCTSALPCVEVGKNLADALVALAQIRFQAFSHDVTESAGNVCVELRNRYGGLLCALE